MIWRGIKVRFLLDKARLMVWAMHHAVALSASLNTRARAALDDLDALR